MCPSAISATRPSSNRPTFNFVNNKKKKGTGPVVLFVLLLTLLLGLLIMRTLKDRAAAPSEPQPTPVPAAAEESSAQPEAGEQSAPSGADGSRPTAVPQLSDVPIEVPEEGTAAEPYAPAEQPEAVQSEESAPFTEYSPRGSNETPDVPLS